MNVSSVSIDLQDVDTVFRDCREHHELITALTIQRARFSACRLHRIPVASPDDPWALLFEELILEIRLMPCGTGPPPLRQTPTVTVVFENVYFGGQPGTFDGQRCVVAPVIGERFARAPLRFHTEDGGFSRLFAGPEGAKLLMQIVSSYALAIMVASPAPAPGGGPTTCNTAIFVGPTGLPEPPRRRHPARCP